MNYSWQRQLILETVHRQRRHMTAAEIFALARRSCPRLSLGTVYRNLNLLVEVGQLRRIGVPGEADRYDWQTNPHQHLFCRVCRQVSNLDLPGKVLDALVYGCPGIRAEDYSLVVVGLCPACRAAAAAAAPALP